MRILFMISANAQISYTGSVHLTQLPSLANRLRGSHWRRQSSTSPVCQSSHKDLNAASTHDYNGNITSNVQNDSDQLTTLASCLLIFLLRVQKLATNKVKHQLFGEISTFFSRTLLLAQPSQQSKART